MKEKVFQFVIFCTIFWLINQTEGQTAKCDFASDYFLWTTGYKPTNASYYTCLLDTREANYNEKLTRIDYQHETGHTDADVKLIQNYKDNKLKRFSSIFCEKFPNLEVIKIHDAELESIDEDSLSNCKNLDKLFLFGNKIRELSENLLIRNSKLTYFWIWNNPLTTLPENFFLNQNKLEQLDLYDNQVNFLPSNIFHSLVKLESLDLHNNKLESINSKWFVNLQNLKELRLDDNQISEIPSKSFVTLRNLEKLWLKVNRIKTLNSDSFDGLHNLQILSLHSNELESINSKWFVNLQNLKELRLDDNQISEIPPKRFASLRNLEKLFLQANKIQAINSDSFVGFHNLQILYLNGNKLESLNPEWFENLQNLKELRLYENQIQEIPKECFASLRNLEELWLNKNQIKTLNSDNFDGLQNLQILTLHINEISDLPVGVFTPLESLKTLGLDNNSLTTIHSDSFGFHNKLTIVYLENNKINAIDPKFIDNTAVSTLNMTNNICSQLNTESKSEIKPNLKKCFDNYKPRYQPQLQVTHPWSPFSTPNQTICGKSSTGEGNIIGGSHISRGSFPWIAALITPAGQFFCGGTLISSRKVLTAAHCIQDKHVAVKTTTGEIIVLLGVHDLNKTFEVGRVVYAVETINVHIDWNTLSTPYDYDIAVLVLDNEVIFNKLIQPICMPTSDSNIIESTTGLVVGFGKSEDETKIHENIPKMLQTPIHTNEHCFLQNYLLATLSSKRTFCGGTGTGVGVCKGDSGSGLIVSDGSAYYLRGIVSSSLIERRYGCDVDNYAVFTDVTKYIDWINGISTSRF